jgi:hypothetical protein
MRDWGLLHESVWRGDDEIVQDLLSYGADVRKRDRFRRTPYDLAMDEMRAESHRFRNSDGSMARAQSILRLLLARAEGKNIDMKKKVLGINHSDSEKNLKEIYKTGHEILKGDKVDSIGRKRIGVSEGTTTAVFKQEASAENRGGLVVLIIAVGVIIFLEMFGSKTLGSNVTDSEG